MTIEQIERNALYLLQCKENYLDGIRPADIHSKNKEGYKRLIEIANLYFGNNLLDRFAGYMMEGQYLIQLWTAHLILEYAQPGVELREHCLDEIKKYSNNPLAPDVSVAEKNWLENFLHANK